ALSNHGGRRQATGRRQPGRPVPGFISPQVVPPCRGGPRTATISPTGRSSAWLERVVWDHEVAGSNPVAPTVFKDKPFGKNVEGLSHCGGQLFPFTIESSNSALPWSPSQGESTQLLAPLHDWQSNPVASYLAPAIQFFRHFALDPHVT